MARLTLHAVPRTSEQLARFGNGDPGRAKTYLLALYGFLASKPENTRRAYQRGIREFFELWDWKSPEKIGVAEAAYYKKWLKSRELSDATVCLRLAACQSFFDFLSKPTGAGDDKPLISSNPFRLVTRKDCTPTPYGRSTPTEWMDFEKILKAIPDDAAGKRDKAMLIFFANTGRRRAEVANLKVRDLNLTSNPKTYVATTKGNKLQTYELSDVCHAAIVEHWISSNRLSTLTANSSVFGPVSHGGSEARDMHRCLTVDQVAKILKSNARRAGLDPRKFKLHSLRHMFAHDLDASGARLQDVQAALGHSLPNTTQIYTGKLRGPAAIGVQKQLDEIRQKAAREAENALD